MKKGFTLIQLLVVVAIVAVLIMVGWILYNTTKEIGKRELRVEAVKMGVARWTVINEQGHAEFRWNSPKAPGGWCMDENGILAAMHMTNEFGTLDVRWLPPSKSVVSATNAVVSPEGYILKLTDPKTGKDIEVIIPTICSNNTVFLNHSNTTIPLKAR